MGITQIAAAAEIEEVVVTARKREESVQRIPVAVSVDTGESLAQRQVNDIYSLSRAVPSLGATANAGPPTVGAPAFSIRGIGTDIQGPQVETSVGIVVDGVAIMKPELANIRFFDIGRIEVLRGPQGMLFGKNAAAGLVNIVTQDPKLGVSETLVHAQYGNMSAPTAGNRVSVDLVNNLPIGEKAALRLATFYNHDDGYIKEINSSSTQDHTGATTYGGRVKLAVDPSDQLKFVLAADYAHEQGMGEAESAYDYYLPGGLAEFLAPGSGITPSKSNRYSAVATEQDNTYEVWGASLKADLDVGGGFTLTNIAAYRSRDQFLTFDTDDFPQVLGEQKVRGLYSQTSDELRLASPNIGPFSFQAGLFYMDYHGRYNIDAFRDYGPPGALHLNLLLDSRIKSAAGYVEGQYRILDNLRLTAGIRYTHDDMEYEISIANLPRATLLPFGPGFTSGASLEKDNVSYRASLDYDISEDLFGYASYTKGYKGPTFDQFTATAVKPEIPTSYELGLKSTLLDNRLRLNVAVFDTTFDNFQVQAVALIGGVQINATTNAGQLKSRGVEAEVTAIPVEGLTVTGRATFLDTKYKNLTNLPCYAGQGSGEGPGLCSPTTGTANANGLSLARAPDFAGNLSVRYEKPMASGWTGFIQGDGNYTGAYSLNAVHDPHTKMRAYTTFGASVGGRSEDEKYGVTVFVRNLTDKRVPANINVSQLEPGSYVHQFNGDSYRTIGISLDYRM
jgi:iron complex outermembrane receptor protein